MVRRWLFLGANDACWRRSEMDGRPNERTNKRQLPWTDDCSWAILPGGRVGGYDETTHDEGSTLVARPNRGAARQPHPLLQHPPRCVSFPWSGPVWSVPVWWRASTKKTGQPRLFRFFRERNQRLNKQTNNHQHHTVYSISFSTFTLPFLHCPPPFCLVLNTVSMDVGCHGGR